MIYKIVNRIREIDSMSYLELGIGDGKNYNNIHAASKMSVDINGIAGFTGTTDDFFDSLDVSDNWDLIFIDANHDYDFVLRDFNNSVGHCKRWVMIHDMIPPTIRHTENRFCSDSYKLLAFFIRSQSVEFYSMAGHMGLTFVKMPARSVYPPLAIQKMNWLEFCKDLKKIPLLNDEEMIRVLNK